MRAFLALPVSETTRAVLCRLQGELPVGRPVPEDNLHLTLAFLGDVSEAVLQDLHDALSHTPMPEADIAFDGLGTFAEMEQGLVFASVVATPALLALQSKVETQARRAGADLPRRRFRPHVTLMRANRQPKGLARDQLAHAIGARPDIQSYRADALHLYQSHLTPNGARHDVIASYPLALPI